MVWLRISPDMDFYMKVDLQGVNYKSSELDVRQYEKAVYDAFVERLKKAFPEADFRIHEMEFGIAREKYTTAA